MPRNPSNNRNSGAQGIRGWDRPMPVPAAEQAQAGQRLALSVGLTFASLLCADLWLGQGWLAARGGEVAQRLGIDPPYAGEFGIFSILAIAYLASSLIVRIAAPAILRTPSRTAAIAARLCQALWSGLLAVSVAILIAGLVAAIL